MSHKNILAYCNRPFKIIEEMDNYIIKQWNDTVTNDDIVIHLGDFAFGSSEEIKNYASRLNGIKYLIKGNHDRKTNTFYEECGFKILSHGYGLNLGSDKYVLSHKPIEDRLIPKGYINLHGHIHNTELSHNYSRDNHKCMSIECLDNYKPMLLVKHINTI